jgi:fatty-acyl-CoA synthase
VSLGVVPFFHVTGMMYGVLAPVWGGSTVIILPRWDRELAGRLISRHQVTHWTCIPTMIIDLFGSPNYKSFDLGSLRYLSGGGAAMPHAVAERLQQEFGLTFAEGYGLTETAAPSHANPPERAKLQCLGMPIFGVDSRVVDPETLKELPPGEVGEIVTRGPMVFKGYWGHPDATAAAFIDIDGHAFFRTGDLGRMDEDGYFFLTDRLKRMINASGYKVWPSEVELLLFKCPAVQEACIIAAKDAYRGETVKAVIVLRAEARGKTSEQDIIDWAREHMAAYKVPRIVEFVDVLPKSGSGKVMWRLLQESRSARQAVPGGGSYVSGLRLQRRLPCDARREVASLNSLHSLRSLRSNSRDESVYEARCARRLPACASRRSPNRPHRVPPSAPAWPCLFGERARPRQQRRVRAGRRAPGSAEKRRARGRAL